HVPDRHDLPGRRERGVGAARGRSPAGGGRVKVAVHAPSVRAGGRLERALLGLHARGHLLQLSGAPAPGSALVSLGESGGRMFGSHDAEVAVGGPSAGGALWLAALSGARAVVLELEAGARRAWNPLVRWGWSVLGGSGILAESEVTAFLALT